MSSADDPGSEKVIVDPNQLDPKGTTAIDFYVPSLDGRLVAVSLSEGGSEEGTVHVYEAATGKELPDVIPRVNRRHRGRQRRLERGRARAFTTPATREATNGPRQTCDFYQQVYFHSWARRPARTSTPSARTFPRIAEIELQTTRDGRHVLAAVANGDGGEFALYLLGPGRQVGAAQPFRGQDHRRQASAWTTTCTCSRARTRRGARSSACPWPIQT